MEVMHMKKILLGIFIAFTCFFVSMLIFGRVKYNKKISYNVEHYLENVNGDGYTLKDTDEHKGKHKKPTEAAYKDYAGFSHDSVVEQKTIFNGKDNTVKLYYTRNSWNARRPRQMCS